MLLLKISLLSYCSFFVLFTFILILFNFSPRKDTHQTQTVKITLVLHCFNHLYFLDGWNEKIQRKIFYYTFYIMLIKNQGLFRFQRLEPPESQTDYLRAKWKNKKVLYWKQNISKHFSYSQKLEQPTDELLSEKPLSWNLSQFCWICTNHTMYFLKETKR